MAWICVMEEAALPEGGMAPIYPLGVNVVMYALCLDYKDDQVHLPYILKRRR